MAQDNKKTLNVSDLKKLLKQHKLSQSGKKATLKARLSAAHISYRKTPVRKSPTKKPKKSPANKSMTVAELKKNLKSKGLKTSGKKAVLKARLARSKKGTMKKKPGRPKKSPASGSSKTIWTGTASKKNNTMTVAELKKRLKSKGLKTSGKKAVLKARLARSKNGTMKKKPGRPQKSPAKSSAKSVTKMTVAELKKRLERFGLSTSGKKSTLKARLARSKKGTMKKKPGRPKKSPKKKS